MIVQWSSTGLSTSLEAPRVHPQLGADEGQKFLYNGSSTGPRRTPPDLAPVSSTLTGSSSSDRLAPSSSDFAASTR